MSTLVREITPSKIVRTTTLSRPGRYRQFPRRSCTIGILTARGLTGVYNSHNVPFIFASASRIFSKRRTPCSRADRPTPVGACKQRGLRTRRQVHQIRTATALYQVPLVCNPTAPETNDFLRKFLSTLQRKQSLSLFVSRFHDPTCMRSTTRNLLLTLNYKVSLLRLNNSRHVDHCSFNLQVTTIFKLSTKLVRPDCRTSIPVPTTHPTSISAGDRQTITLNCYPESMRSKLQTILS